MINFFFLEIFVNTKVCQIPQNFTKFRVFVKLGKGIFVSTSPIGFRIFCLTAPQGINTLWHKIKG